MFMNLYVISLLMKVVFIDEADVIKRLQSS